ncbi:MAG TPA: tetratricopeptide repeat protein [Acidisphaera sp.]|nr:tetratricopeptide repeat protein [Acidisphaera sp.]
MLVDLYRDLIGRSPHDAMLHATLGTVWEVLGRSDSAVAEYREAIRLDANAPRPHTALGNLLLAQGKLDGAAAEFREAIRAEPTDARLHDSRNRGRTPGGVPFRRAGRGSG